MPQMMLPIFPAGVTEINDKLAFKKEDGVVTYFSATMPVFQHSETDIASFKMIVSQFYVLGMAKQSEIVSAFGLNPQLLKRAVKLFKKKGSPGFFEPKKNRGSAVLTESVLMDAQALFDQGMTPSSVAQQLGQKADTIRKAISFGRLHRPSTAPDRGNNREASSKSERSASDSDGEMG
jgi:transposase-like protein